MTEWNATDYSQISTLQKAMAGQSLGRLTLDRSERILDVGCGDGKVTAEIAARVPHGSVLGVDSSQNMINFASNRFGPAGWPNLDFALADVRSLPYRSAFDLVVSFNALHWVPEQDVALRSIRGALKPGGRALLQLVPQGERGAIEDVIEATRRSPRWAGYFRGFGKPFIHPTPQEYATLAEQNGFRVLRIDVSDKTWEFGSREAYVQFSHATYVEWTQHVAEAERSSFINEVLDRYQSVAASTPAEANAQKFYQMVVELAPV